VDRQTGEFWITEEGSVVSQGRVKRIRLARDVMSSAEESVYDTLWTASSAEESAGRDLSRVVQAGYDYLVKHTELSKRTIQRIVEKLIDKDFIAIERPADIYQRSSTVYRVFSYQTVLDRHIEKGRLHVAKLGPGVSYVRPFH
jgi:predicted transcriptional regulator